MSNSRATGLKGEDGSVFIVNTTPWVMTDRPIRTIEVEEDCTFTTLTDVGCTPPDCHVLTLAAGRYTYGKFTAITLATGKIKGYY